MRQKAEYRSSIRSRRLIREAFLQLLKEKELRRITVTEIVRRADINRATFYSHYSDVQGVLEEIENEIIDKLTLVLNEVQFPSFFRDPVPLLLKTTRYLEEDLDFYRTLILSTGSERFLEKLRRCILDYMRSDTALPEDIRSSSIFALRVGYFSGGIITLYQQWFRGELDCPLEDIPLEVGRIIRSSSEELLKALPEGGAPDSPSVSN